MNSKPARSGRTRSFPRLSEASGLREDEIRAAFVAHDFAAAATRTVECYGGELLGFLLARLDSAADANEVFSIFCEDLWTGLPAFRWQCTMRGYCYTLARNAANRYCVAPANRADRHSPCSEVSGFAELIDRVRSRTAPFQRTEVKSRMRVLRERLPEEDQTLLILRVDRELSWSDLAAVMGDNDDAPSPEALAKRSARWRKRFQIVKEKLRELARAEGVLKD